MTDETLYRYAALGMHLKGVIEGLAQCNDVEIMKSIIERAMEVIENPKEQYPCSLNLKIE